MNRLASTLLRNRSRLQAATVAILGLASTLWTGCANFEDPTLSLAQVSAMSPAAEVVGTGAAVQKAHAYVAAHPDAQIALGTGDSMLPLYKDGTMIVIRHVPLDSLKPGMTIVYKSAEGWTVAHALVAKTSAGWVTMGINNPEPDANLVTSRNYVGVVVKAYELAVNPMFALARSLSADEPLLAAAR